MFQTVQPEIKVQNSGNQTVLSYQFVCKQINHNGDVADSSPLDFSLCLLQMKHAKLCKILHMSLFFLVFMNAS